MTASVGLIGFDELPSILPIFPLTGALLLPRGRLPLNIFEPRYLAMVRDAMAGTRLIGMIQPVDSHSREAEPPVFAIGCAGKITSFSETGDGRFLITLTGIARFRVTAELARVTPYRQVLADFGEFAEDLNPPADKENFSRERLYPALRAYLELHGLSADWQAIEQAPAEPLVNALAMICPFTPAEKQALLEADSLETRAETMITLLGMALASRPGDPETPLQ